MTWWLRVKRIRTFAELPFRIDFHQLDSTLLNGQMNKQSSCNNSDKRAIIRFDLAPETGEQSEMRFYGFEEDRNILKYRCPVAVYDLKCKDW